jgi:hypothetical protein
MSLRDNEMHVVAVVGAVVLAALLAVPAVWWASSTSTGIDDDEASSKKVVIRAELAARSQPKKQPQKEFKPPAPPDKDTGVSRDDKKDVKAQCCVSEADCNEVALPFPTSCPDDGRCESHRCKAKQIVKNEDKDPKVVIPDRTGTLKDPDAPTGKPTDNRDGRPDGNPKGLAKVNSGDPWLAELANDFLTYVDFPAIEEASEALACLLIIPDGTIKETTVNPPIGKRSDNDGLNAKIETAFKKLQQDRQAKPSQVPTHLLEQVTKQWTCIPIAAQSRQN